MGYRSGLVPRLTVVVTIFVHDIDIHGIPGTTFTYFTAVDNTGCNSFQDNLSSFYVNTKVLTL
jgi:hypothetical protein